MWASKANVTLGNISFYGCIISYIILIIFHLLVFTHSNNSGGRQNLLRTEAYYLQGKLSHSTGKSTYTKKNKGKNKWKENKQTRKDMGCGAETELEA